jgi:hypothetical protein
MDDVLEVQRTHIHFAFDVDGDWPPVAGESLWVTELDDHRYLVDNIPFFVLGVALNDVVEAAPGPDGCLAFVRKISSGGHSTVRILGSAERRDTHVEQLQALGCGIEGSGFGDLFAVDVPPEVNLVAVLALCKRWLDTNQADYETGCLQR